VGIGVATNVRVSNSVGAQQLPVARRAAALGFVLALLSTVATALLLLAARRPWASLFTADAALMDGVMRVVLVASVYIIADGTTCALGGCLQGCGRQGMAGWVVVFSYYVVGLPLAWLLGFQQKWGVVGLTSGLCVGSYVHCLIYAGMVLTTNWELQVCLQLRCVCGMQSSSSYGIHGPPH
jgi:MATE family multidrug resistance protein